MNSHVTEDFLACFAVLPDSVKAQARKAYRLWRQNPAHPGLQFKKVHAREPICSARISLGWRVLFIGTSSLTLRLGISHHVASHRAIRTP